MMHVLQHRRKAFTVTSDPSFASVSLLLHCNGSGGSTTFTDSSSNTVTVTAAGNAQLSTAQVKYGSASGIFDGTGDKITAPNSAIFDYGTGDLTIECWYYQTNGTGVQWLFDCRDVAAAAGLGIYLWEAGNSIVVNKQGDRISATRPSLNAWHHVAVSRVSGTTRLYVDGTQAGSDYTDGTNYGGDTPRFGLTEDGSSGYIGHIDDIRITKGVGRYSSSFTPPAAQFPDS